MRGILFRVWLDILEEVVRAIILCCQRYLALRTVELSPKHNPVFPKQVCPDL
jgi:hypothetical protein